jgi:hypothetical protein
MDNLGIFGIIVLLLDVYAILQIAQSSVDTIKKAMWIVLVLVLPVLGLIIWYLAGPGEKPGNR